MSIDRTILLLKNIHYSYGKQSVLENISCEIKKGDFVGIVGQNGSGKSTLIKIILNLLQQNIGDIRLFEKSTENFNEWWRIGYVPQNISISNMYFPATVEEVMSLGLLSKKDFSRRITKEDKMNIKLKLTQFNILDLKNKLIGALSGGQLQRVFLAKALLLDPDFLILDEPASALDTATRKEFFSYLQDENQKRRMTILFVTHDMSHIADSANKLMFLDKKVLFYGSFKQFCISPQMTKFFGKEAQHSICHQHIDHEHH